MTSSRDENDDEKRLPREEKLAYELKQEAFRDSWAGLGRIGPGLAGSGQRGGGKRKRRKKKEKKKREERGEGRRKRGEEGERKAFRFSVGFLFPIL